MTGLSLPISLLLVALAQPGDVAGPDAKKEYAADYRASFKEAKDISGLMIYGPEASDCVTFGPDGLRIALPLGYSRVRPGTGVVTDFGVKGDFEITASFQIIQEPNAGLGGDPTDLKLVVVPHEPAAPETWHKANQNRAVLAREAAGRGLLGQFVANATQWDVEAITKDKWGNEHFNKVEQHNSQRARALAKAGQLRLVRSGPVLFFQTSEEAGADFTLLHKFEFGTKDLKNVRIIRATGGAKAALEVRVTDLRIRADGFPKPEETPLLPPPVPIEEERGWPVVLLAIPVAAVALGVMLAAWVYSRRRRRAMPAIAVDEAAPAAPLVFKCPHCAKQLKVKAERAGGKVKCPQCGKAIQVPNAEAP